MLRKTMIALLAIASVSLLGAGRGLGPRRLWRWRFSWRWLRWRRFRGWLVAAASALAELEWVAAVSALADLASVAASAPPRSEAALSFGSTSCGRISGHCGRISRRHRCHQRFPRRLLSRVSARRIHHRQFPFAAAAIGVGVGYGLYGSYDDYDYGYPYAAGYGYDDYYGNGGCYVVRQRVLTSYGWRLRPVQVCG